MALRFVGLELMISGDQIQNLISWVTPLKVKYQSWFGLIRYFLFSNRFNQNYFANTGLFRISSKKGSKLSKLNSARMASSVLLLSTVTFIIAGSLTLGIARSNHRGVVILHSSESFYFRKSPPVSIHLEVLWEIERKRIKKINRKSKEGHAFDWEDCQA